MENFVSELTSNQHPSISPLENNVMVSREIESHLSQMNPSDLLLIEIDQWLEQSKNLTETQEWGIEKDIINRETIQKEIIDIKLDELLGNYQVALTEDELLNNSDKKSQWLERLEEFNEDELIKDGLKKVNQRLSNFLEEKDWESRLKEILGNKWDKEKAESLIKEIIEEKRQPKIEIVEGQILGSQGGYAASKKTIYLEKTLVERAAENPRELEKVIAEELGHYLDHQLNGKIDTKGDEGAKFSAVLFQEAVSIETEKRWNEENDYGKINFEGEIIEIEQSTNEIIGTTGRDILEGTNLNDRIIGGFSADILIGKEGEDSFIYQSIRDAGDIIKDFEIGKDKIDLTLVLESFGYTGNNPLEDGYIVLGDYSKGTIVYLDSDGIGGYSPRPYIQVETVTPTELGSQLDHFCPYPVVIENQPPTVALDTIINSLNENSDTTNPIKVADIVINDDGEGTNNLTLSGTDVALFEIIGDELLLKAGANLDFESQSIYQVNVEVDDTTVGVTPDDSVTYILAITDVNAPPTVTLNNSVASLNENLDTTNPIKVADIVINDDGEGTNSLALSGDDADFFEIVDNVLYLKAGTILDFEDKSSYNVRVEVDDVEVEDTPDGFVDYSLTITDVNQPPTVALDNVINSINENLDTTNAVKVANILITDDGEGTNDLILSGDDAGLFEIVGNGLFLKAGTSLDFETQSSYQVDVEVDDPTVGNTPDAFATYTLTIGDVNAAPTITLNNSVESLNENVDTTNPITVADIVINDDGEGTNNLTLSGDDADFFEIVDNVLYLKVGTTLDFENKSSYNVRVEVDDVEVGDTPDGFVDYSLTITDVNAPPSIILNNSVASLNENTDTTNPIKVADIAINDDGEGSNNLTLSGDDADLFEIVGNELFLKAGANLDFENQSSYQVDVEVDDPTIGGTPDDSVTYTLAITDVNEPPSITLNNPVESLNENLDTTSPVKVADIVINDDEEGTNDLSLSGTDAALFEIIGTELFLKAGTNLDFETQSSYQVNLEVDDPTVGVTPDDSITYTLTISDVNAPPTVTLENPVINLNENTDTTNPIKVADVVINDDGEGTNSLALSGDDADFFEIVDNVLYLKAGTTLDFEDKSSYNVRVEVDDVEIGDTPDGFVDYSLTITDVNESPIVDGNKTITVLEDSGQTLLNINQPTDVDGDNLTITIDTIPDSSQGNILNNGVAVNVGDNLTLEALTNLVFTPVENANGEAGNFTYTVFDGVNAVSQTITINITPVNDSPTLTIPSLPTISEATNFSITGIIVNDIDAEIVQVTLTVNNGVISLSDLQNIIVINGTGNEDGTITIQGNINNVNAALDSLIYRSNLNFEGIENLEITANDLGNTGEGGILEVTETLNINVEATNQPPDAEPDKLLTVDQDSGGNGLNITPPIDPDNDPLTITITEVPDSNLGVLELNNNPVTINQILSSNELQQLVFIPANGVTGNGGNFSYLVEDGQGGSDTQTVTFNISPVIILREEDNFKVIHEETITIPETPSKIRFTYESLNFDFGDIDFINDAFEVALLGNNGESLVYTIDTDKDTFFNSTEEQGIITANGVEIEGNTVSLDVGYLPENTEATLIFRLVNNDSDTETSVRIRGLEIVENTNPITTGVTPNTPVNTATNSINFAVVEDVSSSIIAEYQITSFDEKDKTLSTEVNLKNIGTYGLNDSVIVAIANISSPNICVVDADGITPEGLPYYDFTNLLNNGKLDPEQISQSITFNFRNPQEIQFTYDLVILAEINQPPVIESTPTLEIIGGQTYQYDVNATDINGDNLTYSLTVSPEGMAINSQTGEITWETTIDDIANHQITIEVSDGRGGIDTQTYNLSVISEPPNRPPLFTTSPVVDAYINQLYQYDADAIDPDLDPLSFSLILGPDGMTVNSQTGVVEWTPPPVLVLGDTVFGQIGIPGEKDEFTFSGVLGQQIYFDPLQFTGNRFDWNFEVYSPSGQRIVDTNLESSNNQIITLTETGNYRIVVDANSDVTGSYGFRVIDVNLTPVISLDTVIENQLSPGSEDDIYRFTGNEGQKLFFDSLSSGSLNWVLYDPDNKVVTNSNFSDLELYLPTDGEYKLAIRGTGSLTDITPYRFEIITPDEITRPMNLGNNENLNSVFGEITEKGEEDVYTFTGTTGQKLYFDPLYLDSTATFSHTINITSPSGRSIFSQNLYYGDRDTPFSLPEDGTYRVRIDALGENTGSYSFNLLDVGLATPINLDTDYSGTLSLGQETHFYQFAGTEGQRIFIDSPNDLSGARWTVYDSGNKQVASTSIFSAIELVLDHTDTYTLAIQGNNGTTPVDYSFKIITPDIITNSLTLDTNIVSEITEKGERDIYTFTGTKGQRLFLDTLIDRSDFRVTVVSPSENNLINNISMYRDDFREPFILPETGNYQVIIDGSGEAIGDYGFKLIDVDESPTLTPEILTGNQTLDPGKSIQFYQFVGNEGERIYFDNQENSPNTNWHLYTTSNQELREVSLNSDFEYVLPNDGTYFLMLRGERNDETVPYNIQVVATTTEITPLTINNEVNGDISKLGEQDIYTFDGTVGQTLHFEPRGDNSNVTVTLNSPSGQQIFNLNGNSYSTPITLIEAGTYQLTVDGNTDNTGSYNFVISDAGLPLSFGTEFNGNLETRNTILYQFEGTAGQQLNFDSLNTVSGLTWRLYSEQTLLNGNQIVDSRSFLSDFNVTLPIDGTYTLALLNTSDNDLSYEFQVNDISPTPVVNNGIETLREGTISVGGEIDTYTFTANAGTLIYFDGQDTSNFNFYANLKNPDGSSVVNGLWTGFDYGAYLLPQTGEYTIEVRGNGNSITGDYSFKLVELKTSVNIDLNIQNDIALNPFETKGFKFTGTAGQKIWFDGLNTTNPNITARLLNSSGRQISSLSDLRGDIGLQTLESDGDYYLVLQSNNNADTTASFKLLDNSNATLIDLDTEISGDFGESTLETHLYRFNGTEGQRLYFDRIDGDFWNSYYIYDPSGQQLFSQRFHADYEGITLVADGEYTFIVQGTVNASNNNYNLTIVTPEFTTNSITIDEIINGEISEPGEQDTYTFDAIIGQQIWLDELLGNSSIVATLYSPSNRQVFSTNFGSLDYNTSRPILAETGTYRLVIDGTGETTEAYRFRLLDFADGTLINLDEDISGNFGEIGREAHIYRFDGTEGQRLYFDQKDGDFGNYYYVYDPSGQRLFSQRLYTDYEGLTLPIDGEYTLVFEGDNRSNNNYQLEIVTPDFITNSLIIGDTIEAEISEAGEQDIYTFEGTIGQQIWLDELLGNSSIVATLYNPSNTQVLSTNFGSLDYNTSRPVLAENGTYRLVIDGTGETTEAYRFRLLDFADGTLINLDEDINGNFGETGREAHIYRFNGTEGQRLYFDQKDGDFGNFYYVYAPSGQRLFSQRLYTDYEGLTLSIDGEYTLVFEGDNRSNNNYQLEIVTPDFITNSLIIGDTIEAEISEAGEQDIYTFEGTIGQQIWLDELLGNSSIVATLYNPSNTQVLSTNFGSYDDSSNRPILTENGTYRLVIDGTGDTIQDYSFRLLDFADAPLIDLDTDISGNFGGTQREADIYRFNGSKGQRLYFDRKDGSSSNYYYVYDPSGQRLLSQRLHLDYEDITLELDGNYTIVFEGIQSATNNNYNLEIVTPNFITNSLILGETVQSEITEAGERDVYTFEGTTGQQLFFDALVGNTNLDARLYSPSGALIINRDTNNDWTPFTLTETGIYRLEIDGNLDTIGNYAFKLSDRTLATPLTFDEAITGTLEPNNETILYQIIGSKGTILNFDLEASQWEGNRANWTLYDPNNGILAQPFYYDPDFQVALPSDGLYTLAIAGNSTTPVDYSFQVTDNSVAPIPLTGTNVTAIGTVPDVGDVDSYTFNASAGSLIWIDQLNSTSSGIRTSLKNPDDTYLFTNHVTTDDRGVIRLDQTGEYTLETYGLGTTIGNWQFQILELPTDLTSENYNSLPSNTVIEGTLNPGNSPEIYSFDAQVGEQILFNGMLGIAMEVRIIDPNGQTIYSRDNYNSADSPVLNLTQSGIYHVLINGNSSTEENYAFQLLNFGLTQDIPYTIPVEDTLTSGQESKLYRIEGEADQRLFFNINQGSSSVRIKVLNQNNQNTLRNTTLNPNNSFEVTLPDSGEYTVYIEGGSSSTPIDYQFQIFSFEQTADIVTPGDGETTANNATGILGTFPVQIQVEDGRGGEAIQNYNLRVFPDPDNGSPAIISLPETKLGLNQDIYRYQLESIDPDDDKLRYRLLEAPLGAIINQDTGELIWLAEDIQPGESYQFSVEVSDGRGGSDTQTWDVETFEVLGKIQGVVFEDLNANGIPDSSLVVGEQPDIFFVIDVSGSMGSSTVNWSEVDLESAFNQNLSPLDQELGSILALSEFMIAQGRGDISIGIITSGRDVIDMNPTLEGIQVTTTPLTDSNNNGIADIREVITGGVGGGASDTSGIQNAWDLQQALPGDPNIFFMSDGFISVDDQLIADVRADGVNLLAFGFAEGGMDVMRRVDPEAVYISNPRDMYDIFSGFDPRYITEPLLEGITVYLDLNNNGILDEDEPLQITKQNTSTSTFGQTNFYFTFDDLQPGTYTVRQAVPSGFIETAPESGSFVDTITVGSGETYSHFFGIHKVGDPPNQKPTFTTVAPTDGVDVGEWFRYQARATDPDNDPITYELAVAPEGMTIDPETGLIQWLPTQLPATREVLVTGGGGLNRFVTVPNTGPVDFEIIVTAKDGQGEADIQYFKLTVSPVNTDPTFISIPPQISPQVGKPFEYQAQAIDGDEDTLTYQLSSNLTGLTLDATTGLLSWTPSSSQVGNNEITILVDDGKGGQDQQTFNLTVIDAQPNNAPEIISNPPIQTRVNNLYVYQVVAED
uniref:Ig-like domain-containing protein n=1 Tax=Cyanothece sp. BG0011 TaxID=2082950 RepID=UPI001E494552